MLQYPPPPGPIEAPGSVEQVFMFCLAGLLLLSLVVLALPPKWVRRIVRLALHQTDGTKWEL
jgi:hypothetical protein